MHLHLHAGQGRAGSSAITHYLSENAVLLKENGFVYPEIREFPGHRYNNGLGIANYLYRHTPQHSRIEALVRELTDYKDTVIICSENFARVPASAWSLLREALRNSGVTIKVHFYIREPLERLISAYGQRVKRQRPVGTINEFLEKFDHQRMMLWPVLSRLESVFNKDLAIYLYRRDRLYRSDVRADFLTRLGINSSTLEFSDPVNASGNVVQIEAMRLLNGMGLENWTRKDNRRLLRATSGLKANPISDYVDPKLAAKIQDVLKDDIARVKEAFFPDSEGPLFPPAEYKGLNQDEVSKKCIAYVLKILLSKNSSV